jgi:hypothetical protein
MSYTGFVFHCHGVHSGSSFALVSFVDHVNTLSDCARL